jgi:aminopeptidase
VPTNRTFETLATQVFDTCLGVKPGEAVWIHSWDHTLDLARAFESECTKRHCPSTVTVRFGEQWLDSILHGSREQLQTIPPQSKAALEHTDFYIFTMGPAGPIPWESIPKENRGEVSQWLDTRYDKSAYASQWAKIASANRVKMLAIEATLATSERAKEKGLNYRRWRTMMLHGCSADHKEVAGKAKMLNKVLSGKGRVSISTRAGTWLSFTLDKRTPGISDGISSDTMATDGRVTFLPAGAIEISINEESAEGTIVYDAPVSMGNQTIEDLTLELNDGEILKQTASEGIKEFDRYLTVGGDAAGTLSYFGLGLNPNLKHGFTQDDKVLGNIALGFGDNRALGGRNAAPNQWWASITKPTMEIDGAMIMKDGKLILENLIPDIHA